jgi:hypothetical protein
MLSTPSSTFHRGWLVLIVMLIIVYRNCRDGWLFTNSRDGWLSYEDAGLPIRKEIRSLTREQRERFFTALNVMKHTPTQDGRRSFGPNYQSYDDLTKRHMAATQHPNFLDVHASVAFLPYHRLYLLLWERSLRAIGDGVTRTCTSPPINSYLCLPPLQIRCSRHFRTGTMISMQINHMIA